MLKNNPGWGDAHSPINGRPLSMVIGELPESPSVTGMKGRHRLQREPSSAAASSSAISAPMARFQAGNWCDLERQNLAAYEYLCHVCEAKEWMEACIAEELPGIATIEDSLRDGVALAKLAQKFCPEAVGKIYQSPATATADSGLISSGVRRRFVFKYTDNINFFLRAIRQVRLPRLFHFELTDLYDRKNMPRVIYCLHALSHFLLKMGIAPEMQDLVGRLEFSDAQLAQTQAELDTLGVNVPSFHRIDSDIGARRPRLSREVQPLQPEDIHGVEEEVEEEEPESEYDDDEDKDEFVQQPSRHHQDFDLEFLDDPHIDRLEKAKRYWMKRIDIVVQLQSFGRKRLAERLVEEKRQARRYQRMVESATIMQGMARMVLAKRA
ncbi:iqgap- protein, partial [Coemansia aciculifera]